MTILRQNCSRFAMVQNYMMTLILQFHIRQYTLVIFIYSSNSRQVEISNLTWSCSSKIRNQAKIRLGKVQVRWRTSKFRKMMRLFSFRRSSCSAKVNCNIERAVFECLHVFDVKILKHLRYYFTEIRPCVNIVTSNCEHIDNFGLYLL